MSKIILPFFSYLCHPVFISLFATLYYFWLGNCPLTPGGQLLFLAQILIITVLIPLLLFLLLRSLGKINSFMIENLKQRRIPLVVQGVLFYVLLTQSALLPHMEALYFFFLGALISTGIAFVLTFLNHKASLHMAGMGGMAILMIGLSIHLGVHAIYALAGWLVIIGLVAASRLEMKAHTYLELVVGFMIGLFPQMLLWPLWL